jgi:LuxR family maltose regulon positive regulatory protein
MPPNPVVAPYRGGWLYSSPPTVRAGLWERPRLVRRLAEAVESHRIVLVTAPSGYGKTSGLAAWARGVSTPVAWVTLTPLESTSEVVDLLVARALRELAEAPGAPAGLRSLQGLPAPGGTPEQRWTALRDALLGLRERVVLVVDDCDAADRASRDSLVSALVESGPDQLRIVLVGHEQPPVRLAKVTVAGQVATIGVSDLAFAPDETAGLAELLNRGLTPHQLAELQAWTSGWPVAVHLGLLTAADEPDHRPGDLGGVQRVLADLVIEDVLEALPPDLASFVLDVTVLGGTDVDLARELSGRTEAGVLLQECVDRGLFLDRYDQEGRTLYRWHPVFADLCRSVLWQHDPDRARELHRRAAHALTRAGYPLQAAEHATSAGDEDLAASILQSRWLWAVLETRGTEAAELLGRLTSRPGADPGLVLAHACTLDVAGDRVTARSRYAEAQRAIAAEGGQPDGLVRAMRALAELILSDDVETLGVAADTVRDALESGTVTDESTRAAARFVLGWTELRLRRRPLRAARLLTEAAEACARTGQHELAVRARANLAFATAFAGQFDAALSLLDAVDREPVPARAWTSYDGGVEQFTRGFVAFYRQDLDDAEAHLREALVCQPDGGYVGLVLVHLAFVAAERGLPSAVEEAEAGLVRVPTGDEHGVPWASYLAAARASLLTARGHHQEAADLLEAERPREHTPIVDVISARILERAGRLPGSDAALRRSGGEAPPFVRAHGLVTQALVRLTAGRVEQAHRLLEEALDLAAPQRSRWPFSGRDERLVALLQAHATWGTRHDELVAQQLATVNVESDDRALSPREREILSYLRTTMTTAEIATALFLSVNTVKTHQRAIYRKLGVTSRREAVRVEQLAHRAAQRVTGPPTETIWGGTQRPSSTSGRGR